MTMFFQLLLTGLFVGGIYSLIALGFVIIYKCTKILNFAQGELVLLGAYATWSLLEQFHVPISISIVLAILFAFLVALLIQRAVLSPMIGQPLIAVMMMCIALAAFLSGATTLIWGGPVKSYPAFFPTEAIKVGAINLSQQHVWSFFSAMLLVTILSLFFRYSRMGLMLRATAEDGQVVQGLGMPIDRASAAAWAISAAVSFLGGVLLGSITGISLNLSVIGLKVFPVVLIGGLESILGAMIAGPLVGILESLAAGYLDPVFGGGVREVAPFFFLLLILLIKPYGLFGLKRIERV